MKIKAFSQLDLLDSVVKFKQKFYPSNGARYELAKPGSFRLYPNDYILPSLEKDYEWMGQMIDGQRPTFQHLLTSLKDLEKEINIFPR